MNVERNFTFLKLSLPALHTLAHKSVRPFSLILDWIVAEYLQLKKKIKSAACQPPSTGVKAPFFHRGRDLQQVITGSGFQGVLQELVLEVPHILAVNVGNAVAQKLKALQDWV